MWNGKLKAVTFSYDDGVEQDIRLLEQLDKYGVKCTFNINSGLFEGSDSFDYKGVTVNRIDTKRILSMYKGHEIGAHGCKHLHLTTLTDAEIQHEIGHDKAELERLYSTKVNGMAYACGDYNADVMQSIKACGIKFARTINSTYSLDLPTNLLELNPTCHHNDDRLDGIIDKFLSTTPKTPSLLYIWGHSYEFDGDNNWDKFEAMLQKLSGHDDVFYCTNSQALGLN